MADLKKRKRCRCDVCALYGDGLGLVPVGIEVGLTGEGVRQRLISHGTPVRPPTGRKRTMPNDERLRFLHALDFSKRDIERKTGWSHEIVHRRARELGLTFRRRGRVFLPQAKRRARR
jgi:hypothetical protein